MTWWHSDTYYRNWVVTGYVFAILRRRYFENRLVSLQWIFRKITNDDCLEINVLVGKEMLMVLVLRGRRLVIAYLMFVQQLFLAYNKKKDPRNLSFVRGSSVPTQMLPQIARIVGPTWGPPGSCRPQMGPMLAPRTLLSKPLWCGECFHVMTPSWNVCQSFVTITNQHDNYHVMDIYLDSTYQLWVYFHWWSN